MSGRPFVIDHDSLGGGRRLQLDLDRSLRVELELDDSPELALGVEEEGTVGPLRVSPFEPEAASGISPAKPSSQAGWPSSRRTNP